MEPSKGMIVNYHCLEGERYLGCDDDMILPAIITKVMKGSQSKAISVIVFTNQPSMPFTMRTSISYGMTNGGGWTYRTTVKSVDVKPAIPVTIPSKVS